MMHISLGYSSVPLVRVSMFNRLPNLHPTYSALFLVETITLLLKLTA